MNTSRLIILVLTIILISGIASYYIFEKYDLTTSSTSSGAVSSDSAKTRQYRVSPDNVVIDSPKPGATVEDPLVITGKARGYWFFEGTMPIILVDDTGYTVAEGVAKAMGDWKTTEFVPFEASIDVGSIANTETGILKIERESQSGQSSDYVEMPIVFKKFTKQTSQN